MNSKRLSKHATALAVGLAALAIAASPSFAAELAAVPAQWTPPGGGAPIAMWAYVDASPSAAGYACPGAPVAWAPGPALDATAGGSLTVNIKNCLSDPVSVFIPGQYKTTAPVTFTDGDGRTRVSSFDAQIAAGANGSYTWNGVKEGTYLYHTGTHPQVGVQMGLYGALVVSGTGYPAFGAEQVLLYSEIDPALHAAVSGGTYGTAAYPSSFDYHPQYFLINGVARNPANAPGSPSLNVTTSQDVLLRFVNAGLKTHSPTLGGGLYMSLIAEDGNLYPFPVQQYGLELQAAKTIDAIVNVGSDGSYPLYDRSLGLMNGSATGGGMLVYLQASAASGAPTAVNDSYSVAEDAAGGLVEAAPGVLANDTGGAAAAVLISGPSSGVLTGGLASDGSFTYQPNPNFNGSDSFTYVANDGAGGPDSNVATATITVTPVNDAPVAVADAYDAVEGEILSVASPGVLGNDTDVDGDALTAATSGTPPAELTLNANGSFSFDATLLTAGDSATFDYVANDGTVDSVPATVTITVVVAPPPPDNIAPTANDDTTSITRGTTLSNYNIIANDADPDGTINAASVVITTGTTTQAGGTVINNGDGTITYTPRNTGYRGTDTFQYTVDDNLGATSNVATVRINVTR